MNRIHNSLRELFLRHRILFWYDPKGEWREAFSSFNESEVTKLRIHCNEFSLKKRIVLDEPAHSKFLLYSEDSRPADTDNWLLDLLLQGHEFKADRASITVQELGISYDFRGLAETHAAFFQRKENTQRLKDLITSEDGVPELKLKMVAVLTRAPAEIDSILFAFLNEAAREPLLNPVGEALEQADLADFFWQEVSRIFGYASNSPTLQDFTIALFRGDNPLDADVPPHPHRKVFLQRWKDSAAHRESYREWSHRLSNDLRIEDKLQGFDNPKALADADTFKVFDQFVLHHLCQAFVEGGDLDRIRCVLAARRASFWYEDYRHGYAALAQAVQLRELLETVDLHLDSPESGIQRYCRSWWQIDAAYRRFCFHQRAFGQVSLFEAVVDWVERHYLNNFLLPLSDRWSDQVEKLGSWKFDGIPMQRDFYRDHVVPYLNRNQKVFVVISDALRFEGGQQLVKQLLSEERWKAELGPMVASLPSYTQLGMASLLPGSTLTINPENGNATVDGKSATGLDQRRDIVSSAAGVRATALLAESLLEMKTKPDGRALTRDHDVIYVFHNVIDETGDQSKTETRTSEAVEKCVEELLAILAKIYSMNGNNMLVTADHGFLFQQNQLHEGDACPLPDAGSWLERNRRFAFGRGIQSNPGVKVFEPAQLNLEGNWSVAIPKSLGRFPLQGSGKRYVHGGFSLQEILVPLIHINKIRTDDIRRVEVDWMRTPSKITIGKVSFSVYQTEPVTSKVLGRELRAGVWTKDNKLISEEKTISANLEDAEPRRREFKETLLLAQKTDKYNNQTVELRLNEILPNSSHVVTYKSHAVQIQKPFSADFDDF